MRVDAGPQLRCGTNTSTTAVPSARRTGCSSRGAVAGAATSGRGPPRTVGARPLAAEPAAVGPAHRRPRSRSVACRDQVRRHLLAVCPADGRDEELRCARAASRARASATRATSEAAGQQEGEQRRRRRRATEQREPPHAPGSTSLTPTPRTVCRQPWLGGASRRACGAATTGARRPSCPPRRTAAATPRRAARAW